MSESNATATTGYVDIYLLPVPEKNLDAYRNSAEQFGRVAIEFGASRYREFVGDDLDGFEKAETGHTLVVAVVEFRTRSERDSVMAAVLEDERVKAMLATESPADMERMRYGGFAMFVDPA